MHPYLLQCALLQSNVSYFVFSCVAGRDRLRHVLAQGGRQGTREVAAAPGFPATAEGFSRFGAGSRFGHSLCLHVAGPGRARHPPLFPFVLESSLHAIHPALSRSEATMGVHWVGVRNTGPGSWREGQREAAHLLLPQITVQQGSEAPKFTARGWRAGVQEHQPAAGEGRGSPSVSTAEPVFPPWSFSLSSWGCGSPKEPRGLIRPGGNSSWS